MSAPIPGPVRVVSSNVIPSAPTTNEPPVVNVTDVVETLPTAGGALRRAFIGKHSWPVKLDEDHVSDTDPDVPVTNPGGVRVFYLDIAPGGSTPMHRTTSIDYVTIMKGQNTWITPKGPFNIIDGKPDYKETEEFLFKEGQVVVQRGEFHAWRNDTDEWTRAFVVVLDAEPQKIKVGEETKTLDEAWL